MLTIDEAVAALTQQARPIADAERVSLLVAHQRVLQKDCVAAINVPPADNSAMDGYALRIADELPAGAELPVSQTILAGAPPQPLMPGTAARIFTGAEIPPGANAVIIQENCRHENGRIVTVCPVRTGDNVRLRGQDVRTGAVIARRGDCLDAATLGVLASCGLAGVDVVRKPRVSIVSTGSELVAPGVPLAPGQIYNSNLFCLTALLQQLQCEVLHFAPVEDSLEQTTQILLEAASQSDLVLSTGGVSVGDADHVCNAVRALGRLAFHKVQIKPGKPLAFGEISKHSRNCPLIGLPGNPVSAFVGFLMFVRPFVQALYGRPGRWPEPERWPAAFARPRAQKRPELLRVRLNAGQLQEFPNQSSGVLTSVQWATGLALLPAEQPLRPGDLLEYFSLDSLTRL